MSGHSSQILVGTASWTDKSLIESGGFYPSGVNSAEERLRFYASRFPLVEVDSSYYAMPSARNSHLWAERTPAGFTFDVKAFRLFTTHQTPPEALPKDVQPALPPLTARKRNYYYQDVPPEVKDELWARFRTGVAPLEESNKLGLLLFQFPPWFTPDPPSHQHLVEVRRRLPDQRIAVEFRHARWMGADQINRTLSAVRDQGFALVAVDEPQGFSSSVPLIPAVTSTASVLRLHGRNKQTWEAKNLASSAERFNYLYSSEELKEFVPIARRLAEHAAEVHVIFNNNFGSYAQDNALEFQSLIAGTGARSS
jgi:uncharacterized protein YecE (DUF72 family)